MADKFLYKSFCWSIGTTSFRTVNFNLNIEKQLALLAEFKSVPQNIGKSWQELQRAYYKFMQKNKFVKGDAPNSEKDAREKTSGLVDIGLLDDERNLTLAGKALLKITTAGNFNRDNPLQIANDSFMYLKQLLKTHNNVDGNIVRPFVVFLYAISKLQYLTKDEFSYLLPLCINAQTTATIIANIKDLRHGKTTIDQIIISTIMQIDNYESALDYFIEAKPSTDVICSIGMNRKSNNPSGAQYDKPYFMFYKLLYKVVIDRDGNSVLPLFEQSKKINGKAATLWRKYLFTTTTRAKIKSDKRQTLNDVKLLNAKNEKAFKKMFFEQLHLFKAQSTLSDYYDLNRRYFRTTDVVIFADNKVQLDIIPKCYFSSLADDLLNIAFTACDDLANDISLKKIAPFLTIDEKRLYSDLEKIFGVKIKTTDDARGMIENERYQRFDELIDERFNKAVIIDLLDKFAKRRDDEIRKIITDNADIPTMFEYILGIAWYLISERQGKILDYMKLSLEADLLPKTHAVGGGADIEYLYEKTKNYPAHCLLIEATLTEKTNQRRMEMEPVSRHLGDYILKTNDKNAYALFIATFLHINVISDFRNRKTYTHFNSDNSKKVDGLKILPLQTSELKTILDRELKYSELYGLFERAYHAKTAVDAWYNEEIKTFI